MLRGILKRNSIIFNYSQKLFDASIIFFIFSSLFIEKLSFSFNFIILFTVITLLLNCNGIYESYRLKNLVNIIPNIFYISCSLTIFILLFLGSSINFENTKLIRFFVLCFGYLFSHHFLLRVFLRRIRTKGFNSRKVAFVGNKDSYKDFLKEVNKYPWLGYKVIFWFSPNSDDYKSKHKIYPNYLNCSGSVEDIRNEFFLNDIDKIFFSHNKNDEITFINLVEILGDTYIPLSLLIDWEIHSLSLNKEYFGDLLTLNIWNSDKSNFSKDIKDYADFVIALIAIILLSPLILIISIAIKFESKGSIIFNQKRYGMKGKIFNVYKFRTMYIEKEKENNNNFLKQATIGDKRITKIGGFLRKYSLDELPQLINVLQGDMSLIGPRPHAIEHNELYRKLITGYMQRHSRKPGITGLAQVNGARGETSKIESMELRIKYDLEYINNWNLLTDLIIFLKTIFQIFKGEAY